MRGTKAKQIRAAARAIVAKHGYDFRAVYQSMKRQYKINKQKGIA